MKNFSNVISDDEIRFPLNVSEDVSVADSGEVDRSVAPWLLNN